MLLQLNDLMDNLDQSEDEQLGLIKKLHFLKVQKEQETSDYQIQTEKLLQKRAYLMQFLSLYRNDKVQRQMTIKTLFQSSKSVYEKTMDLVKEIKKGSYSVNFPMEDKMKELESIEKDSELYPLARPLYPIENIQTYFGDSKFQREF